MSDTATTGQAGVIMTALTDGTINSEVVETAEGDRALTAGEVLVLACIIRAKTDLEWGLQMVNWFETHYGDKIDEIEQGQSESADE